MKYIQLTQQGDFLRHLPNTLTVWDENNYCTPEALIKDGKAEQFHVKELYEIDQPQFDALRQSCSYTPVFDGEKWVQQWETINLSADEIKNTRFESDKRRYTKRAAVKDELIAFMAADNMSRVRDGTWTVAQLTNLMDDPALAAANSFMSTLSYELAASAINAATNEALTTTIKNTWISKLQEHFYLE